MFPNFCIFGDNVVMFRLRLKSTSKMFSHIFSTTNSLSFINSIHKSHWHCFFKMTAASCDKNYDNTNIIRKTKTHTLNFSRLNVNYGLKLKGRDSKRFCSQVAAYF